MAVQTKIFCVLFCVTVCNLFLYFQPVCFCTLHISTKYNTIHQSSTHYCHQNPTPPLCSDVPLMSPHIVTSHHTALSIIVTVPVTVNIKLPSAVGGNCSQNISTKRCRSTCDSNTTNVYTSKQTKQHHNRTNGAAEPHSV